MVLDMQMQLLPRHLTDDAVISEFNKDAKNGAFHQTSFAPKVTDKTLGHAMSDFHQPSICILMPSLLFARKTSTTLQQMLAMPLLWVARLSRARPDVAS